MGIILTVFGVLLLLLGIGELASFATGSDALRINVCGIPGFFLTLPIGVVLVRTGRARSGKKSGYA